VLRIAAVPMDLFAVDCEVPHAACTPAGCAASSPRLITVSLRILAVQQGSITSPHQHAVAHLWNHARSLSLSKPKSTSVSRSHSRLYNACKSMTPHSQAADGCPRMRAHCLHTSGSTMNLRVSTLLFDARCCSMMVQAAALVESAPILGANGPLEGIRLHI